MALCMIFNLWVGPGFIFEPYSWCLIFKSHFAIIPLGWDLFSSAHPNLLLFLWCAASENVWRLHLLLLCLKTETEPVSEMLRFCKQSDNGQSPKKRQGLWTSVVSVLCFGFLTFEDGAHSLFWNVSKNFPLSAVWYASRALISHDDLVMQALVCLRMVWFGALRFGEFKTTAHI